MFMLRMTSSLIMITLRYFSLLILLLAAPSLSQQQGTHWRPIEPGAEVAVDFEISYYKLKTRELIGSDETAKISYLNELGEDAGGIEFRFGKLPQYAIDHCSDGFKSFNFHSDSDSPIRVRNTVNIWLIEKRGFKTIIFLNGRQILDFTVSSTWCDGPWEAYWGRKASRLQFQGAWNVGTNYYMITSEEPKCTGKSEEWRFFEVETQFPVAMGTIIPLKCPGNLFHMGDTSVTCIEDEEFSYVMEPVCEKRPVLAVKPAREAIPWHTNVVLYCSFRPGRRRLLGSIDVMNSTTSQYSNVVHDPVYKEFIARGSRREKYNHQSVPSSGEIFFGMRDVSTEDSRSFRCDVPERGLSNVIKINVVEPPTTGVTNLEARSEITEVHLSWDLVPGATIYSLAFGALGDPSSIQSRVSTKTTNYTIEDLIPATNYTVEVSASNLAGIRDGILPAKASFRTKDREPCKAGDYMTETGCQHCGENTYSEDGASSCTSCPDGKVSIAGSSIEGCYYVPCTAGHYMTETGCQQCGENTYSEDGAASCISCPDGKVSNAGSNSIEDCYYAPCSAGHFMTETGCQQCGENTYSGEGASSCSSCPDGKVSNAGSTSVEECSHEVCKAGHYMTESGCQQCGENTYSEDGASSCTSCPEGKVSNAGSTSVEDCKYEPCKAGHYMTETGCQQCGKNTYSEDGASSCTSCPDGKVSNAGSSSDENCYFEPCKAGHYMTKSGCQQCGENTYSEDGASFCTRCPDGKVAAAGSKSAEDCAYELCKAGHYMTESGCQQCGENTYSEDGASSCTSCPDGKVSIAGSTSVEDCKYIPCTAGHYMTETGCQLCGENTYSEDGASSCISCPDGKVSTAGSKSAGDCKYEPCKAGHYMTETGCQQCGENTYSEDGASSCTSCPDGSESAARSTSAENCKEPCKAGDYMTESGCQPCGENTYSEDGASSCKSCPKGKVSNIGSTSVEDCYYAPCSAGQFMTETGCQQCGENTYSEDGASCTSCPDGRESTEGSKSVEDCKHKKMEYFDYETWLEMTTVDIYKPLRELLKNRETENARGDERQEVLVEVVEDDGTPGGKVESVRSRIEKRNVGEGCRVFNKKGWRICTD